MKVQLIRKCKWILSIKVIATNKNDLIMRNECTVVVTEYKFVFVCVTL